MTVFHMKIESPVHRVHPRMCREREHVAVEVGEVVAH